MKIGFIGQGYIGKAYADNYEKRGYDVLRIDKGSSVVDKLHARNCDIVFIAVPAPTVDRYVDLSTIRLSLKYVGKGKIAVIKSTIPPGTVEKFQKEYPNIFVMHSPEFLKAKSPYSDVTYPKRNIIGYSSKAGSEAVAKELLRTMPKAFHSFIVKAEDAELVKYAGNVFLTLKVVYANMIYDLAKSLNADGEKVLEMMGRDPRIGNSHLQAIDEEGKRGAGGLCFIKDLSAFHTMMATQLPLAANMILLLEGLNVEYLVKSGKDMDIFKSVYE